MTVASELQRRYFMNDEQRAIVEHTTGPLLVIAGPGSGKTRSIILLAMNLLLCGKAKPSELLLCTYTEKAAFEMQDRLTFIAKDVHYQGDLSQLRVGTIHSICNQFVTEHLHHTPLGNNYEQLDNFTQQLLIFEHLSEICDHGILTLFQQRWGAPWQIAKKLQFFFDKIVEELIFDKLKDAYPHVRSYTNAHDTFLSCLTFAYRTYQGILARTNRIDFAHLQKCAYNLLQDPIISPRVTSGLRYVLVDEYQDTNYIQEQILRLLARATGSDNLCVVGDEDQALYRFRGATVRNILEFPQKFPGCKEIHLTTNYRSHPRIIHFSNRWINSLDWSHPDGGSSSRTEKTIIPAPNRRHVKYPAVFSISAADTTDEAAQCAEMIATLKQHGNIHDYSEVALLLQSVRPNTSQPYIDALAQHGIAAHCSRARAYFQQTEVQLIVACMARIIGYTEQSRTTAVEQDFLPAYLAECRKLLRQHCQQYPALEQELAGIQREIRQTEENADTPGRPLAEYFYRLIFCQPFITFQQDQVQRQSLVAFSQLLQTFQKYYQHATVTQSQLATIEQDLFHTFFCLLYTDGFNQDENAHQAPISGQVQIMTIHQAKGLEFPVIIVGRLDKPTFQSDHEDKDLQPFYHQAPFEAAQLIPAFDLRRLYYVAFSRAQTLLVLSASRKPQKHFTSLLQQLPVWPQPGQQIQRIALSDEAKVRPAAKPRYSFTSHIQTYETCPRQFQFLREYNFMPAQPADAFAGLLVHQTLERIHRIVIDGQLHILDAQKVHSIFIRTLNFLAHSNLRPLDPDQQERALQQVMSYFRDNQQELQQIEATEMSIQVEKRDYVLTGKIDLLRRGRYGMEIIDFKTRTRPSEDSDRLTFYKQQLYLYAYALEKRTGQLPHRLLIYWTAEPHKRDALMEIPFDEDDIQQVSTHFDQVVTQIKAHNFTINRPPARHICKTCDIRYLCTKQGILH